jgi:hypothetical protein
MGYYN